MLSSRHRRMALGAASLIVLAAAGACHETLTRPVDLPETSARIIYGSMVLATNDSLTFRLSKTPPRRQRPSASRPATGGATRSMSAAATDPFTLDEMLRLSAEYQQWIVIPDGGTAYFRDASLEVDNTMTGSHDGETFRVDIVHPNGYVETGTNIVYHNPDGSHPCWSFGLSSLCDSDIVWMQTWLQIQCADPGTWTIRMYHDGALHRTGTFVLKPIIPPGTVPLMNQGDPAWKSLHYDNSCYGPGGNSIVCPGLKTDRLKTIGNKGCAITSASMMLSYFGVPTTPDQLNTWYETNSLYDEPGGTDFTVLGRYARERTDTLLQWDARYASMATLREKLCRFGPQVLEVKSLSGNAQHFVLAVGMTDDQKDAIINDPNGGVQRNLVATYGGFRSTRTLIGKARADTIPTLNGNIVINFHSPGHLLVTDPSGRRLGYDPNAGRMYAEIPRSYYDTAAALSSVNDDGSFSDDEPDPPKHLELHDATPGTYTVDVTGTGTGTYRLEITGYDAKLAKYTTSFADVPITAGEVHSYRFGYDVATAGSPGGMQLSGSFSGGGQSASSDELLSYSRPAQRQTTLAAGTTSYSLMIFYGSGVIPSTFTAALNGADVRSMFHPTPGGHETVVIPLAAGRNVLKLTARGVVGSRTTSDADQLVFKVP